MRRILITILALGVLGNALADDSATEYVAPQQFGVTVTCSARLPTAVVGCMAERVLFSVGPVELSLGVDAQAALRGIGSSHIAPYLLLAYFGTWSAWAEFRLPELHGLQPLGDPDWLRLGVSWRF